MDPKNLPLVLQWLAGPGAAIVVLYLLSLLVENVPAWEKVPTVIKTFLPMVASVLISLGANALLHNTKFVETLGPIWALVVGAILSYLSSQLAYLNMKRVGYGVRLLSSGKQCK